MPEDVGLWIRRYQWLRQNPAWVTEAFLSGLTPEEFDAALDTAICGDSSPARTVDKMRAKLETT